MTGSVVITSTRGEQVTGTATSVGAWNWNTEGRGFEEVVVVDYTASIDWFIPVSGSWNLRLATVEPPFISYDWVSSGPVNKECLPPKA